MSSDDQHVALPKLQGSPAYARPPAAVAASPRPFDPDELPLEAHRTDEERAFAATLPARAFAPGGTDMDLRADAGGPMTRTIDLRSFARRWLKNA